MNGYGKWIGGLMIGFIVSWSGWNSTKIISLGQDNAVNSVEHAQIKDKLDSVSKKLDIFFDRIKK